MKISEKKENVQVLHYFNLIDCSLSFVLQRKKCFHQGEINNEVEDCADEN